MRRVVKGVNNLFVSLVLVFFYFIVVGTSSVVLNISTKFKKSKEKDSYWEDAGIKKLDINYFKSAY